MKDKVENISGNHVVNVGGGESVTVGTNRTVTVAGAESVAVGTNRTVTVAGAESVTVGTDRDQVGGRETVQIGGDQSTSIGRNRSETVALSHSLTVGKSLLLQAGEDVAIVVGASSIVMKKDGTILIKGRNINIEASWQSHRKGERRYHAQGQQSAAELSRSRPRLARPCCPTSRVALRSGYSAAVQSSSNKADARVPCALQGASGCTFARSCVILLVAGGGALQAPAFSACLGAVQSTTSEPSQGVPTGPSKGILVPAFVPRVAFQATAAYDLFC